MGNLNVNAQDEKGLTPMHYACQEGHHRVVSALIFHGADCNIRTKDGQRTPIQVALASGYPNIAKILYYHGKAQVNITTAKGRTVLHLCAMFADAYDLLEAILAVRKIDIDTQDKYGNTPLHYAVKCGSLEMVKLLVEAGGDFKARNQADMSALHIAIYGGYFGIVEYLVKEAGASPKMLTGILVSILTSKKNFTMKSFCTSKLASIGTWSRVNRSNGNRMISFFCFFIILFPFERFTLDQVPIEASFDVQNDL